MKNIVIGTLAHVDAGKTTLSEGLLFAAGSIRNVGRVDHGNTFLDYNTQEKERGITIFSKQAILSFDDTQMFLIDTPGHVDFSGEMERTLQVLDYAILVISALDGVQAHTLTIWKLLKHYHIPTFIFVNKMDIAYRSKEMLMNDLITKLDSHCINFTINSTQLLEEMAMCDDVLLDEYMQTNQLSDTSIQIAINKRMFFPCFFGSALKMDGIDMLLHKIQQYTVEKSYPDTFGARVFKITRDEQGNQLTHMKITGGTLFAKDRLAENEKVDQIRLYSGTKYKLLDCASSGMICAIKGLQNIGVGQGLGFEEHCEQPILSSYMNYRLVLPSNCDAYTMLQNLQILAQEDPQLHITYAQRLQEIRIQLMGEIQTEVLKRIIAERFHIDVTFDEGSVIYKETIVDAVEGVGHYEPLRHYAEVHILLEPLEVGSGIQIHSNCQIDVLDRHWQRLILLHLEEKEHLGVLTGSPITDMSITLLCGKAHQKHTEGGDFRQATYRAVRQGLKEAKSILLEPYFQYQLYIPQACLSKAIYDIERMNGTYEIINTQDDVALLQGKAPVAKMQYYAHEVTSYTKGNGRLVCTFKDYEPCVDAEKIIEQIGYKADSDVDNCADSIFCSHGAGYVVKWNEVKQKMHMQSDWGKHQIKKASYRTHEQQKVSDEELQAIFKKTYGEAKSHHEKKKKIVKHDLHTSSIKIKPECLLVDGYNIIHDWDVLRDIASENMDAARTRLIDMLCSYQGYKKGILILVFDAYKKDEHQESMEKHGDIYVVYTKKAQTADSYIESTTHRMAKDYLVTIATSDGLEQLITMGQGALRMSARQFALEVENTQHRNREEFERKQKQHRIYLMEGLRTLNQDD